MDRDNDMNGDICFWVTGHSMGAGVANIVAAELLHGYSGINNRTDNVYCYTFAASNTFYLTDNVNISDSVVYPGKKITENYREPHGIKYRCIFNVVNDDDFVPKLPMEECEWTRYGRTAKLSVNSDYKMYLNDLGLTMYYNIADYTFIYRNPNLASFLKKYKGNSSIVDANIIKQFENMFMTNDIRRESYEYNRSSEFEFKYLADSNHSISKNATPFQYTDKNYEIVDIDTIGGLPKNNKNVKVYTQYQMPEYLFQVIANAMHENDDNGNKTFYSGLVNKVKLAAAFLPKHYALRRDKIVEYNDYIIHPHYVESYYALTKMINTTDFK